ncbi:MAG TPA: DUF349 domain-containing protein [Thiothrix sp.]|nr:DUF349 domain-containing protein [Thiothrix sp.]
MFKGLFKPKWQHKKPTVRLQALVSLDASSAELIDLATSDPDLEVRLGAIQHLQHIPTLKQLATELATNSNSATEKLSQSVKKRIVELTLTQPKLVELETVYYLVDDQQIHQQIVCDTRYSSVIRLQALECIDDQALLFKLADTDESRQIQFIAATKLTDYKQLQKLKRLAKTNKKFRHLLKQKSAEYQQKQDFLQQIEAVCKGLENLVDNAETSPDNVLFSTLKQQWQQLEGQGGVSEEARQRVEQASAALEKAYAKYEKEEQKRQPLRDNVEMIFQGLDDLSQALQHSPNDFTQQEFTMGLQTLKTKWQGIKEVLHEQLQNNECQRYYLQYDDKVTVVEQMLASLAKDFQAVEKMRQVCTKIDRLLSTQHMLKKSMLIDVEKHWAKIPAVFTLDTRDYQTHYAEALHKVKQRFKQQIVQCADIEKEINTLLNQVELGVENNQFKGAIKKYYQVNKLFKEASHLNKGAAALISRRIRAMTPAIRQAESWRHWGTDKAREQLTEQATRLITTADIEPLERARKVKALRDDWKKLGKMDPSKHQRLWNEFDKACSTAYEPCQQYFKDEAIQRDKNLEQRHQLCQQLETLTKETNWDNVDWRGIAKTVNTLQGQWRKAGNINRAAWKTVNKRFNQAMDGIEVHLSKERRRNWLQRQNLVTQAETLVANLKDVENDALEQALAEAIQTGKVLQAQWQPTVTAKRAEEQKLWLQFRAAIDAVYERQRNEREAAHDVLKNHLQQKQSLLTEAETLAAQQGEDLLANQHKLAAIEEQFYPLGDLPKGARQKMEKAFSEIKARISQQREMALRQRKLTELLAVGMKYAEKSINPNTDTPMNIAQSLALLLELEILLGLETPKDYQQERMQYQVGRLSEKMLMASEEQQSNEEQALQKIQQWYALEKVAGDTGVMMRERFLPIQTWLENQVASTDK